MLNAGECVKTGWPGGRENMLGMVSLKLTREGYHITILFDHINMQRRALFEGHRFHHAAYITSVNLGIGEEPCQPTSSRTLSPAAIAALGCALQ